MNGLWVVGQFRAETDAGSVWDFQGVFSDRDKAVAACRDASYFIAPATLDAPIQDDQADFPAIEYPLFQPEARE